MNLSETRR